MKKALFIPVILILFILVAPRCAAGTLDSLDDAVSSLDDCLSDEMRERLSHLGYDGDISSAASIGLPELFGELVDDLSAGLSGPLSSLAVIIGVLILSSLTEGYTHSLRYTDAKDIMSLVSSLMTAVVLTPHIITLIQDSVAVISGASSLMMVYVPIMIGIMSFSGHVIQAGGYYAAVMTASQIVSQLSARFIPQVMCSFLAVSVTAGLSGAVRLRGVCDMIGRFIKWTLGIVSTLFAAVLSLQTVMARAGDTVASRAVRFTLSSLIPFIGSAVSEAYKTLQGSVDLLRSGAGVFVIIAVAVSFMPVLVRAILWLLTVNLSRYTAEALGTDAPAGLLSSASSVLGALIAVIICSASVFIISTAVLLRVGGSS